MAASVQEQQLQIANSFSDHHAQVDHAAKTVSQNLQGPYAIKKSGKFWVFDLPYFIDMRYPGAIDYEKLAQMTGLSDLQCRKLVNFMTQSPAPTDEQMATYLQSMKVRGIGDVLGRGGHRLSIESDKAYGKRMHLQISALINSVEGGANVLNFQEEPRWAGESKTRMPIFEKIMSDLGYVRVAYLEKRDVGIWVKKGLKKNFKLIDEKSALFAEVRSDSQEEFCFRGCIVRDNTYLYLNLHAYNRMTAQQTMEDFVTKLIALKNMAQDYADQQQPKLSLIIQGDMNLFMLDSMQQQRLGDAGFVVEPVKGQERFATPTCEAYVRTPSRPTPTLSAIVPSAPYSFSQSSSAPAPHSSYQQHAYVSQQQPPAYAPPYSQQQVFAYAQPPKSDLNNMSLEAKKQWLQTIFMGGFIVMANSNPENNYFIFHQDETVLQQLSYKLSNQLGINGRSGKQKFVVQQQQGKCIILVDENLPLLLGGVTFDATSFSSQQSSSSSAPPPNSMQGPQQSAYSSLYPSQQIHSASSLAPASSKPLPYRVVFSPDLRMIKIAPFKYETAKYFGPFANTTLVGVGTEQYRVPQIIEIDGKMRHFNWPSSEHAYHAQKIIFLKSTLPKESGVQRMLTGMLTEIESANRKYTGEDYKKLVEDNLDGLNSEDLEDYDRLGAYTKNEFDALCQADFNAKHKPKGAIGSFTFMRTVIALKAQQHPQLAEYAMACAREGIFPVEVSQYDYTWAAGPDGTGMNMLGIIWLEIGNALLKSRGETPAIPNPAEYYQQHLQGLKTLSHDALVACTGYPEYWLQLDAKPFNKYKAQRSQKGNGFTLFGGFDKGEKLGATQILIKAIRHYNDNGGSMDRFAEKLTLQQLGALCDGDLGKLVAQIDQGALAVILRAILPVRFSEKDLRENPSVNLEKIDVNLQTAILAAIKSMTPAPGNASAISTPGPRK